jgi:large subunit ribosomal protein L24
MSKWIRKGDQVKVIAGNEKGKTGEVIARSGDRVVVKEVNVRTKHAKPRQAGAQGQIVKFEAPLHISNVQLMNAQGQTVRPKVRVDQDGSRHLVYSDQGQEVVLRTLHKATAKA